MFLQGAVGATLEAKYLSLPLKPMVNHWVTAPVEKGDSRRVWKLCSKTYKSVSVLSWRVQQRFKKNNASASISFAFLLGVQDYFFKNIDFLFKKT